MRTDARRACLTVAALAVFSIVFPRPSEAGTISIDTFFQGVRVGYHLDDAAVDEVTNEIIDLDAIAVIGSVGMSNAVDVAGINSTAAFEAYCVDILTSIFDFGPTDDPPATVTAFGDVMTNWVEPSGLATAAGGGAAAAGLYNQFNPLIEGAGSLDPFSFGTIITNADVARTALAMAIWNELYDGDGLVTFGVGSFYVDCDSTTAGFIANGCTGDAADRNGTIVTLANAFMAAAGSSDATWIQLTNPDGRDIQDFVGPSGAAPQPVPEPSSLALLGIGAAAAAFARRRGRHAR